MIKDIVLRNVADIDFYIFYQQQLDKTANYLAAFTVKNPADRDAFNARWARISADPTVTIKTIVSGERVLGYVLSYVESDKPEVSYWIGKEFWGQGVATRALELFLADGNKQRPIYARAAKDNLGSLRVLQKCNFKVIEETSGFAIAREEEIDELLLELDE